MVNRKSEMVERDKQRVGREEEMLNHVYPAYQKKIEDILKQEKYDDLIPFFQQEEMETLSLMENTIAILNIAVNIYQMEKDEKVTHKIFDGIHAIEEIKEAYLKTKFVMWRLEFLGEEAGFIDYVIGQKISIPYIKYLIHTSSFTKAETVMNIVKLYKEKEYFGQALAMLNYFNELSDDKELMYCEIADICVQTQQYQAAADCIAKIEMPSNLLTEYEKKWDI